jgi:gamma-glutamyltranspeptidase / glutathione hydrolase
MAANVVAASQPLAAQAGLAMLAKGGSAADAAIAAAAALMVVEPVSSGLGADAFALVSSRGEIIGLNASGRTPAARPFDYNGGKISDFGWPSVTVPGAVSGWIQLSERFGKLPFAELFEPAIRYAEEGFLVTPVVARVWRGLKVQYRKFPDTLAFFYPSDSSPAAGTRAKLPALAASLRKISATKGEALYRGELAEQIAAYAKSSGGNLTGDDLANQHAEWVTPLRANYHGATLIEMPPNSQGIAALIAVGLLTHTDLAQHKSDSADAVHLQIEAMRLAFAETYSHVTDRNAMQLSTEELLSTSRLAALAQNISPSTARFPSAETNRSGGTTYLTAADRDGMVVSYIQSSGHGFGSGLVVPTTGIPLQNRAAAFNADPNHINAYAPNKRPFHTNSPAMLLREDCSLMSFGLMGWSVQPQAHVQFVTRAIGGKQSAQAILDAPRWRLAVEEPAIVLEPDLANTIGAELARRGHTIVATERFTPSSTPFGSHLMFGGANLIEELKDGYAAASDPRRDGAAVGF